ncbi:NCS1 family nucleobase:cation symporter-1 [Salmonella enterica subsp. enterica]|nr:NCS1 family nucleobase:cation symporter-1 [Salmonella enterica]EBS1146620.1 NCS1 family nucleobase:cation symporter-1 [Salmonella enterica subsp. enterica serovar Stanley]
MKYNSRLANQDLIPVENQNWSWYSMFCFWMTSVHSLAVYSTVISFFIFGLSIAGILTGLLVGMLLTLFMSNLAGKPGQISGVPYSVVCRQAFGINGALLPSIIRGIIAMCWYGIQTFLLSKALMVTGIKFFPELRELTYHSFLGQSTLGWYCFMSMWAIQLIIFQCGMNVVKKFINFAGPAVYIVMLLLVWYIVNKIGPGNLTFSIKTTHYNLYQSAAKILSIVTLLISFFIPQLLTFADFSRYCQSYSQLKRGNILGLPVNFMIFTLITMTIVAGTYIITGKVIDDPLETVSIINNKAALAIGILTILIATVGVNIVANFVSASFDFSNLYPGKISSRTGGIIAAIGSILITPWNIYNSEVIHYTLDILSIFVSPLYGILIVDFFIINQRNIEIQSLFDDSPSGKYYFTHGINYRAVITLLLSVATGIIIMFTPFLSKASDYNCLTGILSGGIIYYLAWKIRHPRP